VNKNFNLFQEFTAKTDVSVCVGVCTVCMYVYVECKLCHISGFLSSRHFNERKTV